MISIYKGMKNEILFDGEFLFFEKNKTFKALIDARI
jgi:hypothetical protein